MLPPAPESEPIFDSDGKRLSKPVKRKVAVVTGYVGTAFCGSQESTDKTVRTVEGELAEALHKAGAVADGNHGDITKIGWGRTSRTDKGVHASRTVTAMKLLIPPETIDSNGMSQYTKDRVNEHLPKDIRCFSITRVAKSFRGREDCALREYSYYLPKHMLPDEEAVSRFAALLEQFLGTHSFHNYSSGKSRDIKRIRRRVEAAIAKSGGEVGVRGTSSAKDEDEARHRSGDGDVDQQHQEDETAWDGHEEGAVAGSKRSGSRDDWRPRRYKRMAREDQLEEDTWYGKSDRAKHTSSIARSAGDQETEPTGTSTDDHVHGADATGTASSPAAADGVESGGDAKDRVDGEQDAAIDDEHKQVEPAGDEASAPEQAVVGDQDQPTKVILLNEHRTSIYRCKALDELVRIKRAGQELDEEFIRIDIHGKAFVYNQIRLMIGAALVEARGQLWPGFCEAALRTPYKIRVPLAPAEGLLLKAQVFSRNANAVVMDPRHLVNVGGTLIQWGSEEDNQKLRPTGRLQTLMTSAQVEEADRWRDENIVQAIAEAWSASNAAEAFEGVVQRYFVDKEDRPELREAVRSYLEEARERDEAAEQKHNLFRDAARRTGRTDCRYKELLPKHIATRMICRYGLLPGSKVTAIQKGLVMRMRKGQLDYLANLDEMCEFIEATGIDELARNGGYKPPDLSSLEGK